MPSNDSPGDGLNQDDDYAWRYRWDPDHVKDSFDHIHPPTGDPLPSTGNEQAETTIICWDQNHE